MRNIECILWVSFSSPAPLAARDTGSSVVDSRKSKMGYMRDETKEDTHVIADSEVCSEFLGDSYHLKRLHAVTGAAAHSSILVVRIEDFCMRICIEFLYLMSEPINSVTNQSETDEKLELEAVAHDSDSKRHRKFGGGGVDFVIGDVFSLRQTISSR